MLLIGMLDSPYVRRVAISLQLLGLNFEHRSISVFSTFSSSSRSIRWSRPRRWSAMTVKS